MRQKDPYFKFYKYEDPTKPVLTDCEDKMVAVDANCEAVVTLTNTATDEGACQGGWLKWQVFVDLWGDGTYDWEFSTFVSGGTNPADNNNNGIPDIFTAATSSGQTKSITIPDVISWKHEQPQSTMESNRWLRKRNMLRNWIDGSRQESTNTLLCKLKFSSDGKWSS